MQDIFNRLNFAPNDEALMVVPHYATGSSMDGTRQYVWTTSRGCGYNSDGSRWFDPGEARRIAQEATEGNDPF